MPKNQVELHGFCPTCGGPFQEDGIWFSHANDCADALAEDEPRCCENCHGPMCQHDICINNWCGHDSYCTECADREWREIEAEDEARFWSYPGWKDVFEEER